MVNRLRRNGKIMPKQSPPSGEPKLECRAHSWPVLVGDIGGTNARFAVIESPGALPTQVVSMRNADFPGFPAVVAAYLAQVTGKELRRGALAVAGPIEGDLFRFSNIAWEFSVSALVRQLGLESLLLVNDFEALALSIPGLLPSEFLVVGGGHPVETSPIAVIGPGTGLGVAGLLREPEGWRAIPTEGGHSDFAPVTDLEIELLRLLRRKFGEEVSAENVLCGNGIAAMHDALAVIHGDPPRGLTTAEIIDRGTHGVIDDSCARTLSLYCEILGGFVGNVALIAGARGGVVLGGGILPRIPRYLTAGGFRRRFEAKGMMSHYVAAIPTRLILPGDAALRGAAASLERAG